jgi:signal transduction histidine kinase
MLKDIDRLEHLINSILYLSAMERGRMSKKVGHDYHVYEAGLIVREVAREVLRELKVAEHSYQFKGELNCSCVVDRHWLKIVFSNLIDNALKYSMNEPKIEVALKQGSKYFYVDLVDNGIGIEKKDQKRVFNKFERLYHSDSPNVKGTGLGLFWVKQIIEYHGGKIDLESRGRLKGTTFKIALPVYRAYKTRYINRLLRMSKEDKNEKEIPDGQEK